MNDFINAFFSSPEVILGMLGAGFAAVSYYIRAYVDTRLLQHEKIEDEMYKKVELAIAVQGEKVTALMDSVDVLADGVDQLHDSVQVLIKDRLSQKPRAHLARWHTPP